MITANCNECEQEVPLYVGPLGNLQTQPDGRVLFTCWECGHVTLVPEYIDEG